MTEKNVEKPLSLLIDDFKTNLVDLINNSGLPIIISQMILKDIMRDVDELSNKVKETEQKDYEEKSKITELENETNIE